MRRIIIIICCYIFAACNSNTPVEEKKELTVFVLVRHAEKADDGTKDPPLTTDGQQRANALAAILRETEVKALYSTEYKRTRETLAPLSSQKQIEIKNYKAFDYDELMAIYKANRGGVVVMAGHSNNIPWIASMLCGNDTYQDFDERDYDNLIVVFVEQPGNAKRLHLNYGEPVIF
ncbi:MAG TPA: phosphoglycerate mutase family protein [Cyclobacteriaceae bacterium]|nr:phosphoglycerate mutase family protein [Cyclobacteriaceae bacterium]